MNRYKQFNEIFNIIVDGIIVGEDNNGVPTVNTCYDIAQALYDAGYRKQSEGENIGTVHPVDEFICSECGIVLEGWTRVVTDEDDGELYYYEYAFKYCPNCGAKMKGEQE